MVKTKCSIFLLLLIFYLVTNFINSLVSAKSLAVLDEEGKEDFEDPLNKKRKVSRIVEENAYDDKRLPSINFGRLFYIFVAPIIVVCFVVLIIVLTVYIFNKWNEAKLKEMKRRRKREKLKNKKLAKELKKAKEQQITLDMLEALSEEKLPILTPAEEFVSKSFKAMAEKVGSDTKFLSLSKRRGDVHKSEGSGKDKNEKPTKIIILKEDVRIGSVESVPSLDGMKRPKGGALREK